MRNLHSHLSRVLQCGWSAQRSLALVLVLLLGTSSAWAGRLAAGAYNAYAVDADGTVWVWGANVYGQICDGTTNHRYSPARIAGLATVVSVSAGGSHGLARKQDGSLASWGLNTQDSTGRGGGQLGDGTRTNRASPVSVLGATGVTQVIAGSYHSLALQSNGSVSSWGFNQQGQLGDGSAVSRDTPTAVPGASTINALAGGCEHSLALKTDGTVLAWGYNSTGQLGDGTSTNRSTPVAVAGLSNVTAIAAGCAHSIALKKDGTVWAWGFNLEGQLGASTPFIVQRTPVQVVGLSGITAIAAGDHHNLALGSDGRVWTWGKNDKGQLGDGSTTNRTAAAPLAGLSSVSEVAAGQSFSMALTGSGSIYGWGQNDYGQLGNGTTQNTATPLPSRDAGGAEFRLTMAAASSLNTDADKVFSWAERSYPEFFAPANQASNDSVAGVRLRFYAGTGSYLGVNTVGTPHFYYLGPLSNGTVFDFGLLSEWLVRAAP
ncbi:MAG: hypothetical protein CFE43_16660 [Burkholderiales bacterium PBB3]|nr:MAG: hypothetical protein CFE43_16660 [Burkholderiales bacterium PBB3]